MRFAAAALALWLAGGSLASPAQAPKAPSNEDCLACHGDPEAKRANGTSVFIAEQKLEASVHGQAGLACVDCHADLAAVQDFPHADKLARAQCATCHKDPASEYARSIHAAARQKNGNALAASCTDCHGTHEILPATDPASPTYALNLPSTCARCHGDPETIRKGPIAIGNVAVLYKDSIHGRAVLKSGLVTAPTCTTCHGVHDIRRSSDPEARVFRGNIPANCGSCHQGIERQYAEGIHGRLFRGGDRRVPTCIDCHTAHAIRRADVEAWRLDVLRECGSCHAQSQETFRDTYHGQVTNLGFSRIATCADCHEAHRILPASDPRSTISVARRVVTCQKCHPGINANFARYDPHPNPKDRGRDPLLFYSAILMKWLVIGVLSFFGVHTVLWFPRSWRARRIEPASPLPPKKETEEKK